MQSYNGNEMKYKFKIYVFTNNRSKLVLQHYDTIRNVFVLNLYIEFNKLRKGVESEREKEESRISKSWEWEEKY